MKIRKKGADVLIGLAIGTGAYVLQPYGTSKVLGLNLWLLMGGLSAFAAFFLILWSRRPPKQTAALITFGVIVAMAGRIVYDLVFWDSTAHNLAPFELLIAGTSTFILGLLGAYLGRLIAKL